MLVIFFLLHLSFYMFFKTAVFIKVCRGNDSPEEYLFFSSDIFFKLRGESHLGFTDEKLLRTTKTMF